MDSKTRGIVSYITIIGWAIAYFTKQDERDEFENFHLKQALGACLIGIIPVIGIVGLIFMVIGIINANGGEKKYLPLLGEQFESWFSFVG